MPEASVHRRRALPSHLDKRRARREDLALLRRGLPLHRKVPPRQHQSAHSLPGRHQPLANASHRLSHEALGSQVRRRLPIRQGATKDYFAQFQLSRTALRVREDFPPQQQQQYQQQQR